MDNDGRKYTYDKDEGFNLSKPEMSIPSKIDSELKALIAEKLNDVVLKNIQIKDLYHQIDETINIRDAKLFEVRNICFDNTISFPLIIEQNGTLYKMNQTGEIEITHLSVVDEPEVIDEQQP